MQTPITKRFRSIFHFKHTFGYVRKKTLIGLSMHKHPLHPFKFIQVVTVNSDNKWYNSLSCLRIVFAKLLSVPPTAQYTPRVNQQMDETNNFTRENNTTDTEHTAYQL